MSEKEKQLLIASVRLMTEEFNKLVHHIDNDVRKLAERKKGELYELWEKLERSNIKIVENE